MFSSLSSPTTMVVAWFMVLLSMLLSAVVVVESTSNTLYSFKCGHELFLCPGLTRQTACTEPSNVVYYTMTAAECKTMVDAVTRTRGPFGQIKCPSRGSSGGHGNGHGQSQQLGLSHYATYDCGGETSGTLFHSHASSTQCSCPSGSCGIGSCGGGSSFGDPHFVTHDGTSYSFHGECDLVMARSRNLISGLDLDIHGRATDMGGWTLLSNVAVRVGDEIFEVDNTGKHYVNGVPDLEFPIHISSTYNITTSTEILQEKLAKEDPTNEKYSRTWYVLELENNHKIYITRFSGMLAVRVGAHLQDTVGMLGSPSIKTGLVSRTGKVLVDENEMGMEWQVKDDEPMLFHEIRAPQYPEKCIFYEAKSKKHRRRLQQVEYVALANEACASVVPASQKANCIHDVIMTGNELIALDYTTDVGYSSG